MPRDDRRSEPRQSRSTVFRNRRKVSDEENNTPKRRMFPFRSNKANTPPALPPEPSETELLRYRAPAKLNSPEEIQGLAEEVKHFDTLPGECVVCLESFQTTTLETVELRVCKHMFHKECVEESFKHERRCPICRTRVGRLQGKSPSGKMIVSSCPQQCPGYEPATCIRIEYTLPSGVQASYHPNPGEKFRGTIREAFLPDNLGGRQILVRLKYAWKHGLTFGIGTSLTTGQHDCVVWSSVHHKTSITGGPHSFPDPNYMANCNLELDALGIPDSDSCLSEILRIPTKVSLRQVLTDAILYSAPSELRYNNPSAALLKVEDKSKIRGSCCVCLNRLQVPNEPQAAVRLKACSHVVHKDCLHAHLKKGSTTCCPLCRVQVREPHGQSPSGSMLIEAISACCPGFEPSSTIQITYSIPRGVQRSYHPNPGVAFESTNRCAYLPDNEDGQKMLVRLKYAFSHGLTFKIGTSSTTRRPNSVVWSSIIQATSLSGGPFGFPDPGFVYNCNDSLDKLGVPTAESLLKKMPSDAS